MHKRTATKRVKNFLLIKIIGIVLLLLIPINAASDISVQNNNGTPINPQTANLDYWPPVIAKLEAAYAQHPQDPQIINALTNAYNNYGVLLAENKQWSQAESYLQQSITLSPNPAPIKKNLSNVYYEQGLELYKSHDNVSTYSASDAIQLANQAIALDPNNVNAYLLLGDVQYMDQNMPAAQRAWQQAAQLVPDNQEVQKRLAQINRETSVETAMNAVFNPYFNIKMDPSIADNPNFNINEILDYAHDRVAPDFEYLQNFKVPVVVYNKAEYHETMVDAPGWAEAVYDGKIRIAIDPNQKNFKQLISDICHEYTHVIVGVITNNNCPRWFNEGLAKYEEYKHGVSPRIYLLAIAYNTNEIISFDKLNQAIVSPDPQEALLAYQQSFSFVYYIVQRYDMIKVVDVLKALGTKEDFPVAVQQVYGTSLENIENDWRNWLAEFINNWADQPTTDTNDVGYQ